MRGFFFSPSLDGGLEPRRTVQVQSAPEVGVLRLQCLVVGSQPFILGPKRRIVREMGGPQHLVRRSHATSPRNCQMSPMSAAIGSRIGAGVIPTLTHTSALRVSINHPPAQNSRRLLRIGLTQLGSYSGVRRGHGNAADLGGSCQAAVRRAL